MSLISELKRRNVIRVIVLYVISSWVVLQAADVLGSLLPVAAVDRRRCGTDWNPSRKATVW